jgi:hypothetical protein
MAEHAPVVQFREQLLPQRADNARAEALVRAIDLMLAMDDLRELDGCTSHGTVAFRRPGKETAVGVSTSAADPTVYNVQCLPFGPAFQALRLDSLADAISRCVKYADAAPPIPKVTFTADELKQFGLDEL